MLDLQTAQNSVQRVPTPNRSAIFEIQQAGVPDADHPPPRLRIWGNVVRQKFTTPDQTFDGVAGHLQFCCRLRDSEIRRGRLLSSRRLFMRRSPLSPSLIMTSHPNLLDKILSTTLQLHLLEKQNVQRAFIRRCGFLLQRVAEHMPAMASELSQETFCHSPDHFRPVGDRRLEKP
jgi:hypothetical protein